MLTDVQKHGISILHINNSDQWSHMLRYLLKTIVPKAANSKFKTHNETTATMLLGLQAQKSIHVQLLNKSHPLSQVDVLQIPNLNVWNCHFCRTKEVFSLYCSHCRVFSPSCTIHSMYLTILKKQLMQITWNI